MKYKLENANDYINGIGVGFSVFTSLFSGFFLLILLLNENTKFFGAGVLGTLTLIMEFIYGVTVTFLILKKREKYLHLTPFLILNWFIGCFCLNIFVPIFEDLPFWVYLITLLFFISNFFIYQKIQGNSFTLSLFFINGLSYSIILYFTFYLLPLAPFAFIGILLLGIGFYALVPLLVSIIHIATMAHYFQENRKHFISFIAGFGFILVMLSSFVVMLDRESRLINLRRPINSFTSNEDLPNYIKISQSLEPNFFNEILLKKDIVYTGPEKFFNYDLGSFGVEQFNERKVHNPFITIAYIFCEDLNLSQDDQINILKSNFDKRLETEEQLWSGEDLVTKDIKEDVKLYPDSRLAYTEITMDISCEKESWQDKEAIYSFQLPEGSVATSLSLWVNGIERKGILTTKEKAEKAYKQIVGVESRDPSLMQWREGNKVVVRVFPVNYKTPRTFKCGFTTPLKVEDNKLKYESLSIKGPNISNASTISRIQMTGKIDVETSKDFKLQNNFYINESKGLDDWQAIMPLSKISKLNSFAWKEKIYEVKESQKLNIPFNASEVILDLNSNWTLNEIESFVSLKGKEFYVYDDKEKKVINKENFRTIFLDFKYLHYSLLPLFEIKKNSLIITKTGNFSANFEELNESEYLKKIRSKTKSQNLKVINISGGINPFWQTVKEQKYVDFYETNFRNSLKMLQGNYFIKYKTADNVVNIEPSNISIQEKPKDSTIKSNGPNHIYRMYAFGKVLEEQIKIQNDTLSANKYVTLAKDANIVTPISSLIVLETDADYKNNGIEKNVDTLGNSSIKNDGAVPEPHEWLMIIIGLTTLLFYYQKNKKQKA
ncbi:XrtN system VIT domain-containing protein [Flavobacterium sp. ANB]|uniref:XrtN system VIT domain-containing protein n=1 Tax=unclassified Flavobacterium TaxID=196869 RepID=UPI0012B6DC79|nr:MULTISPECIES: XrtN system VIT domain-containing protein [unclassified Flavobacterium]MBF4519248.1 XrtN system VIT domain-containing protein [Flavobacterium sp. ANB]MTD71948.1 XrtN system VIT domain-containing protein [Flavobacterium sp. LC2016-13]